MLQGRRNGKLLVGGDNWLDTDLPSSLLSTQHKHINFSKVVQSNLSYVNSSKVVNLTIMNKQQRHTFTVAVLIQYYVFLLEMRLGWFMIVTCTFVLTTKFIYIHTYLCMYVHNNLMLTYFTCCE